jgi:hypothetical protein
MTEPKWTPGPWYWGSTPGGWDGVRDGTGALICNLSLNNPPNAGLIAAAPELYSALSALVDQVERSGAVDDHGHKLTNLKALHDSRVALANARGRVA